MYVFITILIIVVCVLLGAVVLIQNPKGGGLSASFGGVGQQLLGAKRSTDVVEKLTWGLAFALIFLCLSTTLFVGKKTAAKKDALPKSEIEQMQMAKPGQFPTQPTAPAGGNGQGAPAPQQGPAK
jgi:preprotein translocase subunit SecG